MTPSSPEHRAIAAATLAIDRVLAKEESPAASPGSGPHDLILEQSLREMWTSRDEVTLHIMADGLWWEGTNVLPVDEERSGLVGCLVSSGIHTLTLRAGVEADEMPRFLDLVHRKLRRDEAGELDLVLMLFREDLHFVGYTISTASDEPSATRDPTAGRPAAGAKLRASIREDAAQRHERGVVELEEFDSTLYFLDEREIGYLRSEVRKQVDTDHVRDVLSLLLDTLQLRSETEVRAEVIEALQALLPYLLGSGSFDSLAYLTSEVRALVRDVRFAPEQRDQLDALRSSLSGTGALRQLFLTIEAGNVSASAEDVGTLLRELDHRALETVLVWSAQLKREGSKSALLGALEELFAEWPGFLSRMLASKDRVVVQRALVMVGKLRLPELTEATVAVLEHEDASVRRLAVETLAVIPLPAAAKSVAQVVDDPNSGVRKAAYRTLVQRPYWSTSKSLQRRFDNVDHESVDLTERKLLFSALGATSGPGGVEPLKRVLEGRGIFGRRASSATRACAALGLGLAGGEEARSILERSLKDRDPVVRSAAAQGLRRDR